MKFLLTLLVGLLAFLYLTSAQAQDEKQARFYWEFIYVDVQVHENGDMLVTETQKYVFTAPHTNERYRWISLDRVDRIDSVQVFEGEGLLSATTGVKGNHQWIRWHHPLRPPESHIFVLKYRVIGGLHIHEDGDQVYWKALFKQRSASILTGRVVVRLPTSLAGQILSFRAFGVPADAHAVDAQTVEFVTRGLLPPGKELEVQVIFPHSLLDIPLPAWQQKPISGRDVLIALIFTVPMIGIFVLVRRHFSYAAVPHPITTPPSDLCAPAVSLLESCSPHQGTIFAMVVEMCQRGILTIEVRKKGGSGKDKEFYVTQHDSSDRPWETRLLDAMPATVKVSTLDLEPLREEIFNDLGEYLRSKHRVR